MDVSGQLGGDSTGTFYGFVNASSAPSAGGQQAVAAVVITIASGGGAPSVATITVLPVTGAASAGISPGVAGSNFGPAGSVDSVTLSLYGVVLTPIFTGATTGLCPGSGTTIQIQVGSTTFTCAFTVPSGLPLGALILVAADATSGQTATATFTVNPALATASTPTVSAANIDLGQTPIATTDTFATLGGTGTVTYTVLVSYNSGAYATATATQCATPTGTASNSEVVNCVVGATLATGTYTYEMQLTDSASPAATTTSPASGTVTVNSALTAPSAPTVSATKLDVNQALTVTGTIPSTGTSTYSWQWLISVNGGAYALATTTQCPVNSGSGAAAGATETCAVPASKLTAGNTYNFELKVTDSATTAETMTSAASSTVTVKSALTAPALPSETTTSGTTQTVTGVIPSSGTSTYSWTWLVSVNGGGFVTSSFCTTNSGSGAAGGATETCSATGLVSTSTYSWELKVTDSATTAESATSAATTATAGRPVASPAPTEGPSSAPVSGTGFTVSPPATQIVSDGMVVTVSPSAFLFTAGNARGTISEPTSDRSPGR